jgi:hypothetical protein
LESALPLLLLLFYVMMSACFYDFYLHAHFYKRLEVIMILLGLWEDRAELHAEAP